MTKEDKVGVSRARMAITQTRMIVSRKRNHFIREGIAKEERVEFFHPTLSDGMAGHFKWWKVDMM